MAEAKWAATRFTPFLVIDAEEDSTPHKMDEEEYILQVKGEQCPMKFLQNPKTQGKRHQTEITKQIHCDVPTWHPSTFCTQKVQMICNDIKLSALLQHSVGVEELEDLLCSGWMQLPSLQTVVMALRHLRREGYIDP